MEQKRTKLEKRDGIQATLERHRRFDYDYLPFGVYWRVPDASFRYHGGFLRKAGSVFIRFLTLTAGTALIKICYGAKVTGKENKKLVKKRGAVCVCNHISYLDTLFVRAAVGHYGSYHTVAPWNNKKGFPGAVLRAGGILPFSSNLAATRNLNREIGRLLDGKKIINFYAEQAMWINYQKPRPMKEGAFYYAVKHNVPVLPVFCTFEKNRRGHMKKLRINILPPVYAEEGVPRKEAVTRMKTAAEAAWRACYERAYGAQPEYLPEKHL